jgi:hypothetical protein
MKKLLRLAQKQGCTTERLGSGHWRIITPSGVVLTASFSPGSASSYRATLHELRKAGVLL